MFNFWEEFALSIVMALLRGLKINPARVPYLATTLRHIHDDIEVILGLPVSVQEPPLPPPSVATAAAAAESAAPALVPPYRSILP
jgi:hypothetical protein